LSDEGYEVETAPNGIVALDILNSHDEFVLLFTDIMMPEMDGIELIREARKVRPSLIPIVMTGFATLETARAAVKEGAYDYVLKPFSLSEIKLAVTNAFERHRLTNENARLRELSGLFNISENLVAIREEHKLLDFVLQAALERVGAGRGSIMLTTPNCAELTIAASKGLPDVALGAITKIGSGIAGRVAQSACPLLVEDIRSDQALVSMGLDLKSPSFISVPLVGRMTDGANAQGGNDSPPVLAVLNVSEKSGGEQFTEGDLKILNILANHTSIAMENVRLITDIERAHLSTLTSMALLIEAKDPYTHGHSERVRDLAILAATRLDMAKEEVDLLRLGGGLHDIGKIGVTDGILNKNTKLSEDEWKMIRQHPVIGFDVLQPVHFLTKGHLDLVRHHHERIDGKGYPDGLEGDQVPDLVRILSVADAYDAMSSTRAYRQAMPPDKIVEQIRNGIGTQFDPRIAKLFVDMIESGVIDREVPPPAP
jgi:response regulator RpfG family c-di-GMP phosphodiesterase